MAGVTIEGRDTYTIYDNQSIGKVDIADEVVAIIAGLAATEVEGVSTLSGHITYSDVPRLSRKNLAKAVRIAVEDGVVKVAMTVYLKYGYSIPKTCALVQDKVKSAIENMTGLTVSDVDISIAGVDVDKTK